MGSATEAVEPETKTFRRGVHLILRHRRRSHLLCWGTNTWPSWSWTRKLPLSHGGLLGRSLCIESRSRPLLSKPLDLYLFYSFGHTKTITRYQSKSGAIWCWAVIFASLVSFSKHYNNNSPCDWGLQGGFYNISQSRGCRQPLACKSFDSTQIPNWSLLTRCDYTNVPCVAA